MNKQQALTLLTYDIDKGFGDIPDDLKRDPDIIDAAIELSPYEAYRYMHPEDAKNPIYFMRCVQKTKSCLLFKFAPDEIRENKKLALSVIPYLDHGFSYVSHKVRSDKEFALNFIKKNNGGLKYLTDEIRKDYEVLTLAVSLNGYDFKWVPPEYKHDYTLNKLAIDNGCSLLFLSGKYKNRREFKLEAVKHNLYCFKILKNKDVTDREFILTAIIHHGESAIPFLPEDIELDPTIQLAVKSKDYANMLLNLYRNERSKNAKSNS